MRMHDSKTATRLERAVAQINKYRETVRQEGMRAALAGGSSCPYPNRSDLADLWWEGHDEAWQDLSEEFQTA